MVNHIGKRLKIGFELRMTAQIGDYDMDYIIMDLGFDFNILTRQTWESMGNPRLLWSSVQLRLANHLKVLPTSWLTQVPFEVEGMRTYVEFELIEIVDDTNMYPSLLGMTRRLIIILLSILRKES